MSNLQSSVNVRTEHCVSEKCAAFQTDTGDGLINREVLVLCVAWNFFEGSVRTTHQPMSCGVLNVAADGIKLLGNEAHVGGGGLEHLRDRVRNGSSNDSLGPSSPPTSPALRPAHE